MEAAIDAPIYITGHLHIPGFFLHSVGSWCPNIPTPALITGDCPYHVPVFIVPRVHFALTGPVPFDYGATPAFIQVTRIPTPHNICCSCITRILHCLRYSLTTFFSTYHTRIGALPTVTVPIVSHAQQLLHILD